MSDLILRDRIDCIYRLKFRRSIKSVYHICEKIKLQVSITSEFDDVPIRPTWILWVETLFVSEDESSPQSVESTQSVRTQFWTLNLTAPSQIGSYRIHINCLVDATEDNGIVIMDLWSESFEIQLENVSLSFAPVMPNLRLFTTENKEIWIKEDFGETIGSHVYDSSVILCRYLRHAFSSEELYPDLVIELGSGCGLSGIFSCLSFQCRTILTDLPQQLPLLRGNITMNGLNLQQCVCQELRWGDATSLDNIISNCSVYQKIVILAADVLYDSTAAPLLLQTLHATYTTLQRKKIIIFLAQKNRDTMTVDTAQHRLMGFGKESLLSKLMWQEANVLVWDISFID